MLFSNPHISFDEPIIVFGGPYGNLEATRALFHEAARLGIPAHRMICTGDVVAYCADAAATLSLVRDSGCHVVMGNCEESLGAGLADCGCGFTPGSACDQAASAWYAHASAELDDSARRWAASLPRRIDISIGGRRLAVIHGTAQQINRFIFASTDAALKAEDIALTGCDGIIGGHSGLPFTQIVDGKLWHNAGAIGMPANDGTPHVWFSVISADDSGLRISTRPLAYDHASAAQKIRAAGLPDGYADALETGFWPSCDVLPFDEIRTRGLALERCDVVWSTQPQRPERKRNNVAADLLWPQPGRDARAPLAPDKFRDPYVTANGEARASITLNQLQTLWFNTGTLCNITCRNCYIESSPRNDRLAYLTRAEVSIYLDEIARDGLGTREIGFTGGEPFMNPEIMGMLTDSLDRGYEVLVLTNAMRPMQRHKQALLDLRERFGHKLTIRVSLDHFVRERHEEERGMGTYQPTIDGLVWLSRHDFRIAAAGRTMWGDDLATERAGFAALFAAHNIAIDAFDPAALVLFPEMDSTRDVPEITSACWTILGKSPHDLMCASSRMVVKRKETGRPSVVACTLLPYDKQFELGENLATARTEVPLNHPHCAKFCVLGGASCSAG